MEVERWLGKDYEQRFSTLCHSNKIPVVAPSSNYKSWCRFYVIRNRRQTEINNLLYRELPTGINIIKHETMTAQHLNQGGIHLNKREDGALALNFINDIRIC